MNEETTENRSDEEWKQRLTEEEYRILREAGTEKAFTGDHYDRKEEGSYHCAGCGQLLFSSETKFESGTGWPSFTSPVDSSAIETRPDHSTGRKRTEVICSHCNGHLGHVFEDGPDPSGLRYCINSIALDFISTRNSD